MSRSTGAPIPPRARTTSSAAFILRGPFFLPRDLWIPAPEDLAKNVVQGKTYDVTAGTGRTLWEEVKLRFTHVSGVEGVSEPARIEGPIWGNPRLVRQRLGQGSFRVLVTDTYERRCAITREKALPVLQAAHVRPVTEQGEHRIDNGLLLRSDIHTLFDLGYIGVTGDGEVRVSHRLKKDFDNGEHYYRLNGGQIWLPPRSEDRPNPEFLDWHAEVKFLG